MQSAPRYYQPLFGIYATVLFIDFIRQLAAEPRKIVFIHSNNVKTNEQAKICVAIHVEAVKEWNKLCEVIKGQPLTASLLSREYNVGTLYGDVRASSSLKLAANDDQYQAANIVGVRFSAKELRSLSVNRAIYCAWIGSFSASEVSSTSNIL